MTVDTTVSMVNDMDVFAIGRESIISVNPRTGFVGVASVWHHELNGCHYWTHRGDATIYEFLVGLDKGYAMGKLFDNRALQEFDLEGSIDKIKEYIIENRRDGSYTREKARDLWDDAANCESEQDIANIRIEEAYEFITYKYKSFRDYFWDTVWKPFIEAIKATKLAAKEPVVSK